MPDGRRSGVPARGAPGPGWLWLHPAVAEVPSVGVAVPWSLPGCSLVAPGLLPTSAVTTLAAVTVHRWSVHRDRERGLLDQTTGS
jgi:hypothetical protein